jgi:hypothetical protein
MAASISGKTALAAGCRPGAISHVSHGIFTVGS